MEGANNPGVYAGVVAIARTDILDWLLRDYDNPRQPELENQFCANGFAILSYCRRNYIHSCKPQRLARVTARKSGNAVDWSPFVQSIFVSTAISGGECLALELTCTFSDFSSQPLRGRRLRNLQPPPD